MQNNTVTKLQFCFQRTHAQTVVRLVWCSTHGSSESFELKDASNTPRCVLKTAFALSWFSDEQETR